MALADYTLDLAPETQALRRAGNGQLRGRSLRAADRLIRQLKTAGIWQKLDVLWVMRAPNQTMAVLNWKNPGTFTLTEVNSPTFDKGGYTSNGTTSYLQTGWTASTNGVNYVQNDALFGSFADGGTNTNANMAHLGANVAFTLSMLLRPWVSNLFDGVINCNTDTTTSSSTQYGMNIFQRTGATAVEMFRDGVSVGTGAEASTGVPNTELYICCWNDGGAALFSTTRISLALIGASLTAVQHATLNAAWKTYQQGTEPQ